MKTKFFKKLSFVLVVAMVLSVFYPAAGAFAAAKKPTLNSTNKYLHLDVEGKNKYNFNINNKQSGWKYYWESANEDVAVVNSKNGVTTATGVGKTEVTVTITDKNKEVVTKLSAKVTVRDNIKTVKITNIPEGNKLAVGQENDFNRSFVTVSGSTKKTSAITRWTVDSDKATINDKGVFVANEAGEYTITARSFQSKAKYEDWKKDADTYAKYVLAEDTVKITVAPSIVEVKQVDLSKFKVEFDSPMKEDDVKENLSVALLLGTVESKQYVKSISVDEKDPKVVTVEMYGDFSKGATYVVNYPGMEKETFKAATTNYADVVSMTIDTKTVVAGEEKEIEFTLYNADGVDITDGKDAEFGGELKDRVSFTTDSTGAYVYDNKISIFEVGTVAEVKGTYNTYVYDDNGKEVGTVLAVAQIAGTKAATVPAGALTKWTISAEDPNWDKLNSRVAIGTNPKIYAEVKDTNGKEIKSNDEGVTGFKFESTDDNKLIITDNTLHPIAEGSVVVIVKYGDTIVGYANVSVVPESKAVAFSLSEYKFTLSTKAAAQDSKEITVTLKDQYGENARITKSDIKALDTANSVSDYINAVIDGKKITFTVKADAVAGQAVFEVNYNDLKKTVTVVLAEPNDDGDEAKIRYRLDVNKSVDLAVTEADDLDRTLDIKLIGYAPNGIRTTADIADDVNVDIAVTGPEDLDNGQSFYSYEGAAIKKIKTGTYKVVAKVNDKVVDTQYFSVTDTQKAAVLTKVKEAYYTKTNLEDIAAECFEIKVDGNDHDGVEEVVVTGPNTVGGPIHIKEVKVRENFGDKYIVHTVTVGKTVRPKN